MRLHDDSPLWDTLARGVPALTPEVFDFILGMMGRGDQRASDGSGWMMFLRDRRKCMALPPERVRRHE